MIRSAVIATLSEWGETPADGIITYVDSSKIRSINPGCCFKAAGWKTIGLSKKRGLVLLQYLNK
jgi:hypothetical protein